MLVVHSSFDDAGVYNFGRHVCVVCPVTAYDVGLNRRNELNKQLSVDLPRSHVRSHDGTRIVDSSSLHTPYSRFCTQCCMAPVVEWLHYSGMIPIECGHPLTIDVNKDGHITCEKKLAVVDWGDDVTNISRTVCATIHVGDGMVLVYIRSHGGTSRCNRGSGRRFRRGSGRDTRRDDCDGPSGCSAYGTSDDCCAYGTNSLKHVPESHNTRR